VEKSLLRYLPIITVLVLIFGFGTTGFSYALTDAYNVLISNGWSVKDALGFLGTSIAGTIAMNPSLAPGVAAGALSAYIVYKGSQLYDIYREWRNLRMGIAMLNPVQYSESLSVKQLRKGEYGWKSMAVGFSYYGSGYWYYNFEYVEYYNNNGSVSATGDSFITGGTGTKSFIISLFNDILSYLLPTRWKDEEGKAMITSLIQTAYNYLVANTPYSVYYSREVVAGLELDVVPGYDATLGYRVNVDPASISEDGVQYLNDADAFYTWFVQNYMNGVNQGTYVTPLDDAYAEIRSDLQTIINQLNSFSYGGGVSEETLNQLKTEILTAMNTHVSAIDTTLTGVDNKVSAIDTTLTGVDNKVSAIDTTLTGVDNKVSAIDTTLSGVDNKVSAIDTTLSGVDNKVSAIDTTLSGIKTAVDDLTTTIDEAQQAEQSFWERVMEWLNVSLFEKLQELLVRLFVPTEEQLEGLFDIELPEYQANFVADVSFSSQSASMPISLFGASVDLSGYISQYASGLRQFMNIFLSGLAAFFVIRAFKVHLNID